MYYVYQIRMYSGFSAKVPDHSVLLMGYYGTEGQFIVHNSYSNSYCGTDSFLLYIFITRDVNFAVLRVTCHP